LYCRAFKAKNGIRQSAPFNPPFYLEILMKQSITYTGDFIQELI